LIARSHAKIAATIMPTVQKMMPSRPLNGIRPIAPPTTNASIRSVSECANALARTSSATRS
jgi:hypothetical protein